jgi:hypothetical protein
MKQFTEKTAETLAKYHGFNMTRQQFIANEKSVEELHNMVPEHEAAELFDLLITECINNADIDLYTYLVYNNIYYLLNDQDYDCDDQKDCDKLFKKVMFQLDKLNINEDIKMRFIMVTCRKIQNPSEECERFVINNSQKIISANIKDSKAIGTHIRIHNNSKLYDNNYLIDLVLSIFEEAYYYGNKSIATRKTLAFYIDLIKSLGDQKYAIFKSGDIIFIRNVVDEIVFEVDDPESSEMYSQYHLVCEVFDSAIQEARCSQ